MEGPCSSSTTSGKGTLCQGSLRHGSRRKYSLQLRSQPAAFTGQSRTLRVAIPDSSSEPSAIQSPPSPPGASLPQHRAPGPCPGTPSSSALSLPRQTPLPASASLPELGIRHRPLLLGAEIRTGAGEEPRRAELRLPRAHPFGRRAQVTRSDNRHFELVRERVDCRPAAAAEP